MKAVQSVGFMSVHVETTGVSAVSCFVVLAEVLSAIISVLLVYVLTGFLLYEAVQRTVHMDYSINGDVMLITAAVGVAVNLM